MASTIHKKHGKNESIKIKGVERTFEEEGG